MYMYLEKEALSPLKVITQTTSITLKLLLIRATSSIEYRLDDNHNPKVLDLNLALDVLTISWYIFIKHNAIIFNYIDN